jgi:outer membrane receptor for ferrienterochelin and colicins
MKDYSKSVVSVILCLWCVQAFPQAPVITVLSSEDHLPVEGAIVILRPLDHSTSKKQEIFFADQNGVVANTSSSRSLLIIHCYGCHELTDTIEAGKSYVFEIDKSVVDLDEVVVSGQYDINTSDKSVYRVNVISEKTIEQMGAQNLTDVLSQQLDMRVTQDNILGSSVKMNGISGQNIKILVDGIPVIGRQNGNIDISQINMNNVERIEIIEGPMSVSYGTDALGGLINIVTKKTVSYPLEGDVNFYYETVGTFNGDAAIYFKQGAHSGMLNGGRYFFDGFSTPDTSRYQQWKPKLQYFATFQYNYSGQFLKAALKSEYYNEEVQNKGVPVLTPYQAYAFDDYYFTRRLNESLFLEKRLKNNATIQLTNGYNNYRQIKNTYRKDLVTLQQELSSGEGVQDTSLFDQWTLRGTYSSVLPARKINYQAGYDINLQSGRGGTLSSGVNRIDDYAGFGSFEYEALKNFFVRPGLRFAYNTRYGAPITPSLNVKYDLRGKYNLRASYAHGFRAPSLKELDLSFVDANHNIHGSDSLQAETSDNFSVSLSSKNEVGSGKLKTELSFFYNDIHNIITLAQLDQAANYYSYINVNRYKTRGMSLTSEFMLKYFSFNAGFSLLGLYNTLSDTLEIEKYSLTPEFQMSISATWPKPQLEAAVFLKSTGSTPGFNMNAQGEVYQTFLDSYTLMDFTATKYLANWKVALSAGVKNVFDVTSLTTNAVNGGFHAADATLVPYAMGRFYFASVRCRLVKE